VAKVGQTGVLMKPDVIEASTFETVIPLYIFSNKGWLSSVGLRYSGEGMISKTGEFYYGAFDFEVLHPFESSVNEIEYDLYLVYGPNGERISIGSVQFTNRKEEKEFFGCFELRATPELNVAMDTPRSLVNREY